ncbi:MAG: RNA polymerase sigma factor [Ruminococcaceae bacterium]|nr:RNA polymerase sigma factor [Oscillospiraceae bacterium]
MRDTEIIELYFARDEQAIVETQRSYGKYCQSIAMQILSNPSDAEECVNDTWLRAWNHIPPKRPSPLKIFLGKITRNLAISRYRAGHSRKREHIEVALSELEECVPMPEESSAELSGLLDSFLATLDDTERRMFVGRYWYAYTPEILAEAYGISRNAVNLRIMRTREKLRDYLEKEGYHL